MNPRKLIIGSLLVIIMVVASVATYGIFSERDNNTHTNDLPSTQQPADGVDSNIVACTEEAMICPDGSAVGRSGPDCEFEECPTGSPDAKIE